MINAVFNALLRQMSSVTDKLSIGISAYVEEVSMNNEPSGQQVNFHGYALRIIESARSAHKRHDFRHVRLACATHAHSHRAPRYCQRVRQRQSTAADLQR